jgi:hypothetical protein
MSVVTKVNNFIAAGALNNSQFAQLLDGVEAQYSGLLMCHTVHWLSYGQVLNHFVEMLEVCFSTEKRARLSRIYGLQLVTQFNVFCQFSQHCMIN